ncbi:RGCVC family protein [Pseudonocardia sp. DSM 110487]|uniref:RGCVC family protein n=1 Tax=Pseudonocardia sp. DSM 110487 TaxID=2865833 RepID=UPI001C6A4816|nr:RGCVC family protein [Pseudonocardia sp. DSM 110487]QYN38279.1 RGCVC family protein [Pseudonocardia sp. DSM 110487]
MSQEQRIPSIDAPPTAPASSTAHAPEADTDLRCAACPHDRDAHDPIGTRFCTATIAGGLSRGCVCVGLAPASTHQSR